MAYASNKPTRTDGGRLARRFADERWRWYYAAQEAKRPARDVAGMPIPHPMTRPYLLAHPEREIAEVRYVGIYIGVYCAACNRWIATPATGHLPADYPYLEAHVHNSRRHPRRAARLTQ